MQPPSRIMLALLACLPACQTWAAGPACIVVLEGPSPGFVHVSRAEADGTLGAGDGVPRDRRVADDSCRKRNRSHKRVTVALQVGEEVMVRAAGQEVLPRRHAIIFIVFLGIVSLFGDMTYEGARSITGIMQP